MESYEDLRLEKNDKIPRLSLMERLFKKNHSISQENLDFLEERYINAGEDFPKEDFKLQEDDEIRSLDDVLLELKEEDSGQTTQLTNLDSEEKEEVLEVDLSHKEIPFRSVCFALILMFVALLAFVPKIYIRNNIYYTSRNLIQLQVQLDSLNEENKHIKKQLEYIKFKNLTHELDF